MWSTLILNVENRLWHGYAIHNTSRYSTSHWLTSFVKFVWGRNDIKGSPRLELDNLNTPGDVNDVNSFSLCPSFYVHPSAMFEQVSTLSNCTVVCDGTCIEWSLYAKRSICNCFFSLRTFTTIKCTNLIKCCVFCGRYRAIFCNSEARREFVNSFMLTICRPRKPSAVNKSTKTAWTDFWLNFCLHIISINRIMSYRI